MDLAGGGDGDGGGEQAFALADVAGEDGFGDQPQVDACVVADDLPVVRGIAVEEGDGEAELAGVEVAGVLDVCGEELWLD